MPKHVDKGADEQGTLSVIPVARNSGICAEGFTKTPLYFIVCSVQSRLFTWQLLCRAFCIQRSIRSSPHFMRSIRLLITHAGPNYGSGRLAGPVPVRNYNRCSFEAPPLKDVAELSSIVQMSTIRCSLMTPAPDRRPDRRVMRCQAGMARASNALPCRDKRYTDTGVDCGKS